jgi:hypothetical protein
MAKEAKKVKLLQIVAKRNGFRRAGIAHPDTAVLHRFDKFTKEQIEALKNEPQLVVMETEGPDPDEKPEADDDGKDKQ